MKQLFTILGLAFAMISFGQSGCVANFSYTLDSVNNTITFQDESVSYDSTQGQTTPSSWYWEIYDGAGSYDTFSTSIVNYNYTTLPVTAYLTVNFDNGCSDVFADTITAGEASDPCENFYAYESYDIVKPGACDGELTASVNAGTAPFTFSWSNGENTQTISNLCAGNYGYTVTDANGCVATSTAYVTENDSTNLQIIDSLSNPTIDTCLNFTPADVYVSNVLIIDSFLVEVEWSFVSSNQQIQMLTKTYTFGGVLGQYYVEISINCIAKTVNTWSDVITIDENTVTGINNVESINNLSLYPNPVKDVLNIEFVSNENSELNVQVISYTGQIISNTKVNAISGKNNITINAENLNQGVYFVRINNSTLKFVK